MSHQSLPLAIVGAGFSGTMTALQVLRAMPDVPVLLCERSSRFARGTAYATENSVHLLNVRATNMSAYPDEPDHFVRWLAAEVAQAPVAEIARHIRDSAAGTFVSRDLYGRYLSGLLRDDLRSTDGALRLRVVPDEVVDLEPAEEGYVLTLAGGRRHRVAGAILAIGNLHADVPAPGRYFEDPWSERLSEDLEPGRPVVILGSGLTTVDVTMQLWASGFAGPVIAISRHGLLPRTHVPSTPWPLPALTDDERGSVLRLLRRIRREAEAARAEGAAWQDVLDALRPATATLWQRLPLVEQRRFLRHARRWWDVHRHRTAPPIAQQLHGLVQQGYLSVEAGRVTNVETVDGHARVTYRPRGRSGEVHIEAQRVVDATGVAPAGDVESPLLTSLLRRGLVTLDRHRLGLEVSERLEAIGTRGGVTPGLWALGPIVRGVFWECTAVPDIRRQAAEVADIVADSGPRSRRGPATFGPPAWRALEATARRLAPVR